MLEYLLKSAACMAAFLIFYQFLLEKESMHQFKRFFLLGALVTSLIIPGLVFTEYIEASPQTILPTATTYITNNVSASGELATDMDVINWSLILWTIYGVGVFAFGFRFGKHLYQILQRIRKNPKLKGNFITQVLLFEKMPPHTFFSYIFLNKQELERKAIPNEVLLHEETHAKQFHSLDVLFIELLQVILWFNPLLLLFKKNIKLNHEFLADSAVLNQSIPTKKYQNTLLSYLSVDSAEKYQSIKVANAINYSSIKKRFTIMKKRTSRFSIASRTLLSVTLLAVLLFGFSEKKIIEKDTNPESAEQNINTVENLQVGASEEQIREYSALAKNHNLFIDFGITPRTSEVTRTKQLYELMTEKQKREAIILPDYNSVQKSASREQMKEYNTLAKKYNEMPKNDMRILMKDVEKLKYIYSIMSDKQKADAEPFPNFPEPPPPPKSPMVKKGEKSNIPPPPSKPTKAPRVKKGEVSDIPPPPPPQAPIAPLDHIIEMAKKGATFYYEGKEISSDKAIEVLKKNKSLNVETTQTNSKNPKVRITKKPITIGSTKTNLGVETGNIKLNGNELFYSRKNGVTTYFNEGGEMVDAQGERLGNTTQPKPTFYFNGEQISSIKAHKLLRNNRSIQVTTKDISETEYAIVLTDMNKVNIQKYNRNHNPNSVIDLTEMISKEASFYYNDEPISTEKAVWLTQNEEIERVQTLGSKNGNPKVYLWKKV